MTLLTLTPTHAEDLLLVQVLSVHWLHDDTANEQGYALHYRTQGNATGITLLADERSERDPPLYLGDWVRLRPIGSRRHTLVDNLTLTRAADAEKVDWVAVCLRPALTLMVAPAQQLAVDAETPPCPVAAAVSRLEEARAQQLAAKYPDVAAFLAALDKPGRVSRALADSAYRQACTNGGW